MKTSWLPGISFTRKTFSIVSQSKTVNHATFHSSPKGYRSPLMCVYSCVTLQFGPLRSFSTAICSTFLAGKWPSLRDKGYQKKRETWLLVQRKTIFGPFFFLLFPRSKKIEWPEACCTLCLVSSNPIFQLLPLREIYEPQHLLARICPQYKLAVYSIAL